MYSKKYYMYFINTILVLGVIFMSYYIFDNLSKEFVASYERNHTSLQKELTKVNDVLEIYGNVANNIINRDNIADNFRESDIDNVIDYFEYNQEGDYFHLDNITNSDVDVTEINNITGSGNLDFLQDENDIKTKEIYLSIIMNKYFHTMNKKIVASYWVYYTSLNEFLSIRKSSDEFVLSSEFKYVDDLLDMPFVVEGEKDFLKDRTNVFWTHPYIDLGGGGLMVTSSYPVDYNGKYLGSISVDFMSSSLNEKIDDNYITFLIDEKGTIISSNIKNINYETQLTYLKDIPIKISLDELTKLEYNKLHYVNNLKIISNHIEETPYVMYQVYLPQSLVYDMLINMIPLFIFIILFVLINITYHKVYEAKEKLRITNKTLESKKEELDYVAKFDALTNVYNRRGLYNKLEEFENKELLENPSVIMIDIDRFKKVNDEFGHDVGDHVLEEVCKVINNLIGNTEIVARFGGEEFIVVSLEKDFNKVINFAEKIRMSIENHTFKINRKITISLGVANANNISINSLWYKNADNALLNAKNNGRNLTCYYEDGKIKVYKKTN